MTLDPGEAWRLLSGLGIPLVEDGLPPGPPGTFSGGAAAGIEVPGLQGPRDLEAFLQTCDRLGVPGPARVVETRGFGELDRDAARAMVRMCSERGIGLVASITPRATRSRSRFATSPQGARLACRLWGSAQLEAGLADALRSVELGVRGLLVYDEGLLEVLDRLRGEGSLPPSLHLKASIALGCSNAPRARQLQALGADSVNPVNDLPPTELAALRRALRIPLDVHVDDSKDAAGADRLAELPELVAAAAPVFLKTGSGARDPSPTGKAERLARVQEAFEEGCPELELLEAGAPECAVPEPA